MGLSIDAQYKKAFFTLRGQAPPGLGSFTLAELELKVEPSPSIST